MASTPTSMVKDAHYHAIAVTTRWADLVAAMAADVRRSAEDRERRDEQRRRETTYARNELGGH